MSAWPVQRWAVASLIGARIVYAINWLNIGALFYLMGPDLNSGVSGLGVLTATFYLGVGLMQIPGSILAAVWGPKRTVTTGIIVASLAVLGTSVSQSVLEIAALRFVVGTGMAMVFAPMVVLTARLLGGRSGLGAGLVNSAFDFGGLFGLFGWILIAATTGWRPSLLLSGTLGLISALLVIALVPRDEKNTRFRFSAQKLKGVLRKKLLILLGLGALGSNLGSVLISSFMVYYLHASLQETAPVAGLVASLVVILPIATSLWGGRLYDRLRRPRPILVTTGIGMVISLILCSVPLTIAAALGSFVGGIAVGPSSTVAFAAARDMSGVDKEYESLTIGWVNCISLTGSVWPPVVFSFLAATYGYSSAWLGGAILSLAFLAPLLFGFERSSENNQDSSVRE
ncbi:MAG TPA: MFS transporter [Candidatus Bathyarchaeia archaeon]|nr:MFS transporter [Candidatus Bathyarchaeia archaeon]